MIVKPKKLLIFCDNCRGYYKNKTIMHFFHWAVHTKKWFDEVVINSLIVGHTKFYVDRHFGYRKKDFRKLDKIESLKDIMLECEKK